MWISFVDGDDKKNVQGVATKNEMSGNWYEWIVPGTEQQCPELSEDVTMNGTTTYNLDLNKSRVNHNKLEREESAFKNNVLGTSREGIEMELDGMNNPTISNIIIADTNRVSLLDDIEGYADDGRASEAWRQIKSWRKLMNCDQASTQPLDKHVNIFEVAVELLIGECRSVEHSSQKAVAFYGGKDAFKSVMLLITLDGHHHEAVGNTINNFLKENNQLPRTINSAVGILICEYNESSRNDGSGGLL